MITRTLQMYIRYYVTQYFMQFVNNYNIVFFLDYVTKFKYLVCGIELM